MPPPILAVVIRGESFRPPIMRGYDVTNPSAGSTSNAFDLQAAASATHVRFLHILCAPSRLWKCTLDLFTYPTNYSSQLERFYHNRTHTTPRLNLLDNVWPWHREAFSQAPNTPASTAFALLNFRFDMEFKEPENFAARIADAAAAIHTNQTKSPTLGNGSEWEAVPSPTSILVAFRTRSGLKLGVNVRGPKIGWIYNLRLKCVHTTSKGRPRVADVLHLVPRAFFSLAYGRTRLSSGIGVYLPYFREDLADRLHHPTQLQWCVPELADSDSWKANNSLYTLNTRPSNRALSPQPAEEIRLDEPGCPQLDVAGGWWPELAAQK